MSWELSSILNLCDDIRQDQPSTEHSFSGCGNREHPSFSEFHDAFGSNHMIYKNNETLFSGYLSYLCGLKYCS